MSRGYESQVVPPLIWLSVGPKNVEREGGPAGGAS